MITFIFTLDPIKNENKAIESKPTDNKSLFGDVAGGLFAASQTSQPLENKGLFGNILNAKNDAPQPSIFLILHSFSFF